MNISKLTIAPSQLLRILACCVLFITIAIATVSCEDEIVLTESVKQESDQYWYTRTRSAEQQQAMLRNFGIGFSYEAIKGEKCKSEYVRCQVLNLDALDREDYVVINENSRSDERKVSHSYSEYLHNTNFKVTGDADIILYKVNYSKAASVFEHAHDTLMCVTNTKKISTGYRYLNTDLLSMKIDENPRRYLSESFLYALDKLERSNDNVAVVDSFINVFGTHVVTYASTGAKLSVDFVNSRKSATTQAQETTLVNHSLNLLVFEKNIQLSSDDQRLVKTFIESASISIEASGGDLSHLSSLISNPKSFSTTSEDIDRWIESVRNNDEDYWNQNSELTDMEVTPIWEFIPNEHVAKLVQSRIIATAPTMQELYGNRNFINIMLDLSPRPVTTQFATGSVIISEPSVVDIIAANRHVATVCREWIPEIDPYNTVTVAYPIYENVLDNASGICIHNNIAYRVKWLYGKYQVEKINENYPGTMVYLNCGYFELNAVNKMDYQSYARIVGYEWPGSIKIDGSISRTTKPIETVRFLGDFYLKATGDSFDNLPGWYYTTSNMHNKNYDTWFSKLGDLPYQLSSMGIGNRKNREHTVNRMVRSSDYVYSINPNEFKIKYE